MPTESINLAEKRSNVSPDELPGLISGSKPQFTFYRHPDSPALVFIYTCPSSSSIKERMLNASSRRSILHLAESEGVKVTHKVCSINRKFARNHVLTRDNRSRQPTETRSPRRDWKKRSTRPRSSLRPGDSRDQRDPAGKRAAGSM